MQYTINQPYKCMQKQKIFLSLHLITSHKKSMEQNSVLHQYYNKITFPNF